LKEDDVTFAHNSQYGLQGNNRPKIRLMLARITDYVETQSGQNSCYQEYIKYDIEHIWANRPELHDKEFDHEYDFQEYRDRIGGLLLLPPKRNKDFSNKSYEDKLEDY
ncbi:HNH endonuclease, partial [Candidatus Poribacteria bacterium]|nr:HNH endonuclease [Candidatus Poribacteria bacterium]